MSRKIAREKAYQILFGINFDEDFDYKLSLDEMQKEWNLNIDDLNFVNELCLGVQEKKIELQEKLESFLKDYKLSQLNKADKIVLLIALFELFYTKTPQKVVVNEAVEISKKYGIEKSPKFVNGVLAGAIKKLWVKTWLA